MPDSNRIRSSLNACVAYQEGGQISWHGHDACEHQQVAQQHKCDAFFPEPAQAIGDLAVALLGKGVGATKPTVKA
jgi:hypothetical protein